MFPTLVRQNRSVSIKPFSVATPTFSRARSRVLGTTPTATSILSASTTRSLPSLRRTTARTPPSVASLLFTAASVIISIPALASERLSPSPTSISSRGRISGISSTSVTLLPAALKYHAISTPIAPPPTISMFSGAVCIASASRLETMVLPSNSNPGSSLAEPPAAMMMFSAVTVSATSPLRVITSV